MFATVKIVAAVRQSVPVIPMTAIVERGQKAVVLVEEAPGRYRKTAGRPSVTWVDGVVTGQWRLKNRRANRDERRVLY
jgi:hypothetical protein